jgi:serine/threonine-protein kinase HipA
MAGRSLVVLLHGAIVGVVEQTDGALRFSYDRDRLNWQFDITPLSLSLPPRAEPYLAGAIGSYLWGLLPENPAVLDRWARDFRISAGNPVALLEHVGLDCPGAVQFVPPARLDDIAHGGGVEWLTEQEVAGLLRILRRDSTAWHTGSGEGQFSLAGAQAKMALFREDGRWGLPYGRMATTHIIKPAIPGLESQDINEHLCLSAAGRLGMATARTSIQVFDGETAVAVERYDRLHGGSSRIHQEDMCQALGVHPAHKYQSDGGPSPENIAKLLHSVQSPELANRSVSDFVDALALNWWLAGTDAHAKNYSLLLDHDQVRLAPLYDISSALPYPDSINPRKMKLAMRIGHRYRISEIGRAQWEQLAVNLRLEPDQVVQRIIWLGERLPDALSDSASEPSVVSLDSTLPARLLDAVGERVCFGLRQLN